MGVIQGHLRTVAASEWRQSQDSPFCRNIQPKIKHPSPKSAIDNNPMVVWGDEVPKRRIAKPPITKMMEVRNKKLRARNKMGLVGRLSESAVD